MGTPAFPNLGKHCSDKDCRQIDFLPFTCDCCQKVFCLEHRSYARHQCPKGNKHDVTVVICPLCAKGVRLIPNEDPNITWESHVNIECDPSNYEKATKKRKCPVPRCREVLTFSNTVKCRDCEVDHCLKHRLGLDHKCPGPKKPEPAFPLIGLFSKKDEPKSGPSSSSSRWTTSLLNAATSGIAKLSNDLNQTLHIGNKDGGGGQSKHKVEKCPLCNLRFSTGKALVEHVQKVHEKNGVMNITIDVCPMCSKGFRDAVKLVEHVERDHGGTSKQSRA
ncbi:unnamed protein product [Cuscuta campestris]|uniref:AN1-type domain-containing protein n=1 Tax=Cuscuta campestris TaxID=132261 RepID=A0A484L7M7_9ASTE|nr:unnamed protein product [Cuscuta campestris]